MPSLEYFLVARSVVIDQFTNAVSVFSIVDEIVPKKLPATFMRLTALIGLNVEKDELGQQASYRVAVRIPGQDAPLESEFDFTLEWFRHRYAPSFIGVTVPAAGNLEFTLYINDQEVARHQVLIHPPGAGVTHSDGWLVYERDQSAS
jgi:hypothetical protein